MSIGGKWIVQDVTTKNHFSAIDHPYQNGFLSNHHLYLDEQFSPKRLLLGAHQTTHYFTDACKLSLLFAQNHLESQELDP
jgi:hypothetical protein